MPLFRCNRLQRAGTGAPPPQQSVLNMIIAIESMHHAGDRRGWQA